MLQSQITSVELATAPALGMSHLLKRTDTKWTPYLGRQRSAIRYQKPNPFLNALLFSSPSGNLGLHRRFEMDGQQSNLWLKTNSIGDSVRGLFSQEGLSAFEMILQVGYIGDDRQALPARGWADTLSNRSKGSKRQFVLHQR